MCHSLRMENNSENTGLDVLSLHTASLMINGISESLNEKGKLMELAAIMEGRPDKVGAIREFTEAVTRKLQICAETLIKDAPELPPVFQKVIDDMGMGDA